MQLCSGPTGVRMHLLFDDVSILGNKHMLRQIVATIHSIDRCYSNFGVSNIVCTPGLQQHQRKGFHSPAKWSGVFPSASCANTSASQSNRAPRVERCHIVKQYVTVFDHRDYVHWFRSQYEGRRKTSWALQHSAATCKTVSPGSIGTDCAKCPTSDVRCLGFVHVIACQSHWQNSTCIQFCRIFHWYYG